MTNSYLRKTNAENPMQRLFDVAEPPQPIPLAIALDLANPLSPPLASNPEALSNHLVSPEVPPLDVEHQANDVIAGRYRILDVLGQGGVGITYRASDLQTGQEVALKALSLHSMQD